MALDYANEWWVRLYTRDTTTWKLLSWEARSILVHLLRKVDRAGVLEVGDDGAAGLAAIIDMPEDVVAAHLPALVARKCVEFTGTAFILPNFIEAQETPSSDKQRKRSSREARRARSRTGQTVTNRDSESQIVTDGHERSHEVTNGHSEKRREEKTEHTSGLPDPLFLTLTDSEPDRDIKPDKAADLAAHATAAINRVTGRTFDPASKATLKLVKALVKAGATPEQVTSVVERKAAEWLGTSLADRVCPATLLAADNFARYLDEIRAGPVRAAGTANHRPSPPPTLPRITVENVT